jgi:hypothetical protein
VHGAAALLSHEKIWFVVSLTKVFFPQASLTKVIGTTTASMVLYEQGLLKLDMRVIWAVIS